MYKVIRRVVSRRASRRVASRRVASSRPPVSRALLLLGCDTNDLSKSRSELMDVLLTTQCVRLTTFAQSKRGSVLRQREIQQILVPRCQFPRFAPTGVSRHAHRCQLDTTGVSGHAHRCQWPRCRADRCQSSCPPVSVPTLARRMRFMTNVTAQTPRNAIYDECHSSNASERDL